MWNNRVFQVAISTHNSMQTIERCLNSVNDSLKKENWHLVIGDDGSTDDTLIVMKELVKDLSCESNLILTYPKADNISIAKNRVLSVCGAHADERPAVLGMDADDVMLPDRVRLFDHAARSLDEVDLVVGPWKFSKNEDDYKKNISITQNIYSCYEKLEFGWWATLFHARLIPPNGNVFPEKYDFYSDIILWNKIRHLNHRNIQMQAADNITEPVHHYILDPTHSATKKDSEKTNEQRKELWETVAKIEQDGRAKAQAEATETDDGNILGVLI